MGRTVLGSVAAKLAFGVLFACSRGAFAEPAPPPDAAVGAESGPAPQPAAPLMGGDAEPPALDPPPPAEPTRGPTFLRPPPDDEPARARGKPRALNDKLPRPDFVDLASPWVDFTLTSFYLEDRVGNFLNFGIQAGGYFFEHLRVSGRLVVPTERVEDEDDDSGASGDIGVPNGGFTFTRHSPSRNMSVLYGASVGLVITNERSFVFGPSLGFVRTDVEDYGTAFLVGLPFEWTTGRNLRVGFELALGHATGGTGRSSCVTNTGGVSTSCGVSSYEREGGTSVLFSYYMGWSLGRL